MILIRAIISHTELAECAERTLIYNQNFLCDLCELCERKDSIYIKPKGVAHETKKSARQGKKSA